MATTAISAFNEFLKDKVNLDPEDTKRARASRDWLVDRIHEFPSKDNSFPLFYQDKDIFLALLPEKQRKESLTI